MRINNTFEGPFVLFCRIYLKSRRNSRNFKNIPSDPFEIYPQIILKSISSSNKIVAYCTNGDAFGYTSHSFRFVLFQKINLKIYSKSLQQRDS